MIKIFSLRFEKLYQGEPIETLAKRKLQTLILMSNENNYCKTKQINFQMKSSKIKRNERSKST